ncbi:hypothetical protein H105_00740 [Trichophyton soudanense CBS 452.61]|uniref:Uncharacterized protein n=1 Tax=Trichophyton soudanense CBS 452.61 TaxID=1215331 RepID=A0A022Y5D7_TRISD|nr:hypothetical protein H105_00740 [Trichophyton soudanense CBS 452.61]
MVNDLNGAIRKLDGLRVALVDARPLVDPSEDLLVPNERVLWLGDPMGLIGEVKETAGNTLLLEDVEETDTLSNGETEVEVVVDDELWLRAIPAVIVLASLEEGSVELEIMVSRGCFSFHGVNTYVVFNEEELVSSDLGGSNEGTVMGDEGLELASEVLSLDPVDHETTEGGTGSNTVVSVNVLDVVVDVFPDLDKILVWSTTPVVGDVVGQLLAETSATSWVRSNDNVSLVSPDAWVPAGAPVVTPGALRTTVDEESKWVDLVLIETGWLDDPRVDLGASTIDPERLNIVGTKTLELRIMLVGIEELAVRAVGSSNLVESVGPERVTADEDRFGAADEVKRADGTVVLDNSRLVVVASISGEGEELSGSVVLSSDVEGAAIRRPLDSLGRTVPVAGNALNWLVSANLSNVDDTAVRLVVLSCHLEVGNSLAIWREDWAGGSTLNALWSARTIALVNGLSDAGTIVWNEEDVRGGEVGLWKLWGLAHEGDGLAIRGEIVVTRAAEWWVRRLSVLDGLNEVLELAIEAVLVSALGESTREDGIELSPNIGIPVANEKTVVDASRADSLLSGGLIVEVTLSCGLTVTNEVDLVSGLGKLEARERSVDGTGLVAVAIVST